MAEHIRRFLEPRGIYTLWIREGVIIDWVILNFCTSVSSNIYGMISPLYVLHVLSYRNKFTDLVCVLGFRV